MEPPDAADTLDAAFVEPADALCAEIMASRCRRMA